MLKYDFDTKTQFSTKVHFLVEPQLKFNELSVRGGGDKFSFCREIKSLGDNYFVLPAQCCSKLYKQTHIG